MDSLIRRYNAEADGDLMFCDKQGIAYQRNMANRVQYDAKYLSKIDAYDKTIEAAVNSGRVALLGRHLSPGSSVLDIGAGSMTFMRAAMAAGYKAKGFDVIPETMGQLRTEGLFSEDPQEFDAVTLWDTIEHMESPERTLRSVPKGRHLFASIPVFEDLRRVRESKHYRPGEHLYYWTAEGFVNWMQLRGFRLLETSTHEMDAGRDHIGAFAFKRDFPDYRDHIGAYKEIHSTRHYGNSATEEYLTVVADIVRQRKPRSILDYGCGRSDLVAHFWRDGERRIARYDPAIPEFKLMPEGRFDLILCCDVMEHIPMTGVDRVLSEVRSKGDVAFFAISTKLARAKLPDGRNAHVTLLAKDEWRRWVGEAFGGAVKELPSKHEHELILLAGVQ